jgi:hypothetical protein
MAAKRRKKRKKGFVFVRFVPLGGNCPRLSTGGLFGAGSRGAVPPVFQPFAGSDSGY